ncbi:hypothetical protein TARUN_57 [Trichoderma arundinaceum]|uniref:Uncharacterized protein n=1 Tax=Trichoderma arundinaceum TaxID=490622 RepID=A0A395P180_TRIAR|nr:hypothetical protein TARUN_57 [Trichoderma arundinaceum]
MSVGEGYSLDLVFYQPYANEASLFLNSPLLQESVNIASTGFCSYPPVFRWSELQLISRAIAAHDPSTFTNQDLALMLLVRFTPLCVGDSVNTVITTIHTFLSTLGFEFKEIRHVLRTIDHRSAGFRWRFDEIINGWVLQRYRSYTCGPSLHTYRTTDNKDFPFEMWPQFLSVAEETIRTSTSIVVSRGLQGTTMSALPDYQLSAQYGFYLAVPLGISPRPLFPNAQICLNMALNHILEDLDLGCSIYSGSSRSIEREEVRFEIQMYGVFEQCQRVLRQTLWWQAAPEESLLSDLNYSRSSRLHPLKSKPENPQDDSVQFHIVFGKLGALFNRPTIRPMQGSSCNAIFQSALDECEAHYDMEGWRTLRTTDGGEISVCVSKLSILRKEDLTTVTIRKLTPNVARFLFRILVIGDLVLFPALLTTIEGESYPLKVLTSEDELLRILHDGPYKWWCNWKKDG